LLCRRGLRTSGPGAAGFREEGRSSAMLFERLVRIPAGSSSSASEPQMAKCM